MPTKATGTLNVDGFQLNYRIEGTGIPAIVIGSSIYYPRTFSEHLRANIQMIFMDHRGFGKALKPFDTASFELDVLIDDIETLRQKLGLAKIIIIGHSGHAFMALEYAKKYPEHVSHVVLIASSPSGHADAFQAADQYFDESASPERKSLYEHRMQDLKNAIDSNPDKRFILYSLLSGPRIWYDYEYDATPLWENVQVIPEMFDHVWGSLFKEIDITKGLEALNRPVLLMLGQYDYWNPTHLWNPVQSAFKNLSVHIFEKSGHTPQLEEPALFDNALLQWLSKST